MKKIIAIIATGLALQSSSQNQTDIFRYSYQGIPGTARSLGLSGAWGAAGADLSSASWNPAGLALYRRNEMMASMGVTANLSKTQYTGNFMNDSRTAFNIPNIGMVFSLNDQFTGAGKQSGLVGGSVAFGVNRLTDFQSNVQYSGSASNTTVGDYLAKKAKGTNISTMWNEELNNELPVQAWRLSLIDSVVGSNTEYRSINAAKGDNNFKVRQWEQLQTRGRMNEWYAGGGLNFSNVFYLGATVVLQTVTFSSDKSYHETMVESSLTNNPYESSVIHQTLRTSGSGVGGKFGFILRPTDFIRIGASYHTPVRLTLTDYYQNSMDMRFNGKSYNEPGREDTYKYDIITPQHLNAGGTIIINKTLLINGDYEVVDYRQGRLQSTDGITDFSAANTLNKSMYGLAQNLRAGIEYNLGYTRLRAGYAYLGSPYDETFVRKENGAKHVISAGLGWVYDNTYFFDFAVSHRIGRDYITPYDGNPTSAVNTVHKLNFVFGAGYKF